MMHNTLQRCFRSTVGRACAALLAITIVVGCDRTAKSSPQVVLYASADAPLVQQVVDVFKQKTGINVLLKGDTEAGKTTGLVQRIRAERDRPRADVFWSSELFNTIKLAREGLLAEYRPPAEGIPNRYKDPQGRWVAFGARARVLAYNTDVVQPDALPKTWRALADPRWQGKLGVADPRFGTTGGHVAAMYALWGEPQYIQWLTELNKTCRGVWQDGNATAARRVGRGELTLCATDTDDVYARRNRGEPVAMTCPDMGDGGTLLIPNSVAMLAGAPNPEAAKKLIDFLSSPELERLLALSDSRNIPVRAALREALQIEMPPETKIGFDAIADAFDQAIRLAGQYVHP